MISAKSFSRFFFLISVLGNVLSFTQYRTIFGNDREYEGYVSNVNESAEIKYNTATTTLRTILYLSDEERNSSANATITSIQSDASMETEKTTVYLDEDERRTKNQHRLQSLTSGNDVNNTNESSATKYNTATATLTTVNINNEEINLSPNSNTSLQPEFDPFTTTQKITVHLNEEKYYGNESDATEYNTATANLRTTPYINEAKRNSNANLNRSFRSKFDLSIINLNEVEENLSNLNESDATGCNNATTTVRTTVNIDKEKRNSRANSNTSIQRTLIPENESEALENTNKNNASYEIVFHSRSTIQITTRNERGEEITTKQLNMASGDNENSEKQYANDIEKNNSTINEVVKQERYNNSIFTTSTDIPDGIRYPNRTIVQKIRPFENGQINGSNQNVESKTTDSSQSSREKSGYNSSEKEFTYNIQTNEDEDTPNITEITIKKNRLNESKPDRAMHQNNLDKWKTTGKQTSSKSSNEAIGEIIPKTSSSPTEDIENGLNKNVSSIWIETSEATIDERNNTETKIDDNNIDKTEETTITNSTTKKTTIEENIPEVTTIKTIKSRSAILNELKNHTLTVDIKNHPYIVSIQKEMIHSCCGTIIGSSWIMTTSHCLTQPGSDVKLVDITKIAVVAGQSQLGLGKMQIRRAKNLFLHNRFVKKMLLNDIGLINLYEPFELNDYVNVVLLSSSISKPYKFFTSCYVISWTVYRKDFLSFDKLRAEDEKTKRLFKVPELQMIELPTITYEECSDRIEAKDFITRNQICTEYGSFKNVSCAADAGSPLICGERQYGIFSWGIGCDVDDYPGVFTKVSSFRKWINNVEADPEEYILRNKGIAGIHLIYSMLILIEMYIFILN